MAIRGWQVAGVIAVCVAGGALLTERAPSRWTERAGRSRVKEPARKVYPYSVIPGGVASGVELRTALLNNPVARAHYADFRVDRTQMEHLGKAKAMYVSYRIADRVFWTKKRILLPQGEAILTDGVTAARTRCGNRLSDTPQSPTNAAEPAAAEWDTALDEDERTGSRGLPAEAASGVKEASQVQSSVKPPGDYLASFGPQSVTSGAGSASSGSGGFGGGGGGFGGGGGAGGGNSPGSGSPNPGAPLATNPPAGVGNIPVVVASGSGPGGASIPTAPSGLVPAPTPIQLPPLQGTPTGIGPTGVQSPQAPGSNWYPTTGQVISIPPVPLGVSASGSLAVVPVLTTAAPPKRDQVPATIAPGEDSIKYVPTPEPRTLILMGSALTLLLYRIHRRRLVPRAVKCEIIQRDGASP